VRICLIVFFGVWMLIASGTAAMAQEDYDSQNPDAYQQQSPDQQDPNASQQSPDQQDPNASQPNQAPAPATPAPSDQPAKAAKPKSMALATARAFPHRTVFVGDEPIALTYVIVVRTGFALEDESFRFDEVAPFKAVSVTVGNRVAALHEKDVDRQQVEVTLRLAENLPHGVYRVPRIAVRYAYDDVVTGRDGTLVKFRRKGVVYAPEVFLQKVPLYVETDTLHERVHIGDPIVLRIRIHAETAAEILNEFPPEKPKAGITYLSTFSLKEPLTVLRNEREESVSSTYRVLTYRYTYSILDIQQKPYAVPAPPVLWRLRGVKESGEVKTVAPAPTQVTVTSILPKDAGLEPQKGAAPDPARERMVLFILPLAIAVSLGTGLSAWGCYGLVIFLRTRKKRKGLEVPVDDEIAVRDPVYESFIDRWWRLPRALTRATRRYNAEPNEQHCVALRHLLARYAVSRLRGDQRIDRDKACSMTAAELRAIRDFPELPLVGMLESCLETCTYDRVQDS